MRIALPIRTCTGVRDSTQCGKSLYATISNTDISKLTDSEIINYAKQDGATIIDSGEGRFRGCMVLLRPSADTQAEIGIGKGARHSSASKMSAEARCLAITVSQDGPITVYDSGERILTICRNTALKDTYCGTGGGAFRSSSGRFFSKG